MEDEKTIAKVDVALATYNTKNRSLIKVIFFL